MILVEHTASFSVWHIVGVVALACLGFVIYNILKGAFSSEKEHSGSSGSVGHDDIAGEFSLIVKYFSGCMNPLTDIVEGSGLDTDDIVFQNLSQIVKSHGSERLKSWYFSFENDRNRWGAALYKDKASTILNLLTKCGVARIDEREIVWNENTSRRYGKLSKIEAGQRCVVLAPCWMYQNDIFEKGLVKIM